MPFGAGGRLGWRRIFERGQPQSVTPVALYRIEATIRGDPPDKCKAVRQEHATPLIDDLDAWLHEQLTRISGKSALAGAIRYSLIRMKRLRPYLENGFLELDSNTAERPMRSIAVGRKNWPFAGSKRGGKSAAIAYTLIETAKLDGVDPQDCSPMSSAALPTTRSIGSTNYCLGNSVHRWVNRN